MKLDYWLSWLVISVIALSAGDTTVLLTNKETNKQRQSPLTVKEQGLIHVF